MKNVTLLSKYSQIFYFILITSCLLLTAAQAQTKEKVLALSVQDTIGFEEVPVVHVEVDIEKTRDLHVVFQDMETWRPAKRTVKRLKKSGKYHFKMPMDNLKPGKKYRVDAFITPRKKDWNDKIGKTVSKVMEVVNSPTTAPKNIFSQHDRIKAVTWPKQVSGTGEVTLTIQYDIKQPRDIHIKLLSSKDWKEHGSLKFPLSKPGNISLPINDMTTDFPPGKYAWVIYLSESGELEPLHKKFGKHFVLTNE